MIKNRGIVTEKSNIPMFKPHAWIKCQITDGIAVLWVTIRKMPAAIQSDKQAGKIRESLSI